MELFGSSGYRAVADRNFMDVAFRLGFAVGSVASSALIGSDTRTSSGAAKHCVASALLASGCKTYDAGIVPTPTLAFNCRNFAVGVMITASHNPPQYNGIKLWNPDGSAFDTGQRHRIELLVERSTAPTASWEDMESLRTMPDAVQQHADFIMRGFPERLRLKVVVDCGGGAGSVITPYLLQQLGCHVITLNCTTTGFFPRDAEPTEESLKDLSQTVRSVGADIGLAHDADADRLTVVDETGMFVPGDKLMVLLAREVGAKSIVTTVDASMSIEEQGFKTTRTRVGDAYVSEELKKGGGDFGGEPCGAWFFPTVSYCPDGIYAAALVAKLATKKKLSVQAASLPSYPMRRGSTPGDRSLMGRIEPALLRLDPISLSREDGLRAGFADGWLLVRPSRTEPRIRITAEAKTVQRAETLYDRALAAIKGIESA